jgi:hypothetical protein
VLQKILLLPNLAPESYTLWSLQFIESEGQSIEVKELKKLKSVKNILCSWMSQNVLFSKRAEAVNAGSTPYSSTTFRRH